ncbi:MAG TPA: glycine cleavage system aminomethyltransferase GcvT [Solirubrobacteraceae bacterium]|nr:glycine cleavage system aminomethyltransferase GcvT [Solirubrobacteraceae bacterium]
MSTVELRRTPLYEAHRAAGAKLVAFAGWEMPIQYGSIKAEHLAVRTDVGIFDVSHMGQIQTHGPQALQRLQRLSSNDVRRMPDWGAQYSLLCREDGGVIDDLFSYRLSETDFLTVTNAANHARDLAWFQTHGGEYDADVTDCADRFAMIAVQGPRARALLASLTRDLLPPRFHIAPITLAGASMLAAGTGYTGEDGLELLVDPADAAAVWAALLGAGAAPVGLGARDTLRLEACFHLYGNDLSEDRDPIGAGLGWACREDTGFVGAAAVAAARARGPREVLVPFIMEGPGIARQGNPVVGPAPGGVVTSGTFSPMLERGIGMAYVPAAAADVGQILSIDVRGTVREARVASKPLYRKDG